MRFLVPLLFGLLLMAVPPSGLGQAWTDQPYPDARRQQAMLLALREACEAGSLGEVQTLIRQGVNVNGECEKYGEKPFFRGIRSGSLEIVKSFLSAGAKVNEPDSHGRTALSVAALGGEPADLERTLSLLQLLISHGAEIKTQGHIAIAAAAGNSLPVVQQLIAAGAKPEPPALVKAMCCAKPDIFDFLLTQGVDPKSSLDEGQCLIHILPDEAWLKKLLGLGLDINARDDTGRTPLHVASRQLDGAAAKLLLDHHAFVNAQGVKGNTPLMSMGDSRRSSYELEELLLERGADVAIRNSEGKTVVDLAVERKRWSLANRVLDVGAKAENPEKLLTYLLNLAVEEPISADTIEKLVRGLIAQMGTRLPLQTVKSPLLTWAVRMNHLQLAQCLADKGANLNAADEGGRTPRMWAEITGSKTLAAFLKRRGAMADLRDNEGRTASDWRRWRDDTMRRWSSGESDESILFLQDAPVEASATVRLFTAVADGDLENVKSIVTKEPATTMQTYGGLLPLHVAAARGHVEIAKYLAAQGAALNAANPQKETPVELAVKAAQVDMVVWLLSEAEGAVRTEMQSAAGEAALSNQQLPVLEALLRSGWQPANKMAGAEALALAVEHKDKKLLRRLLDAGARPAALVDDPYSFRRAVPIFKGAAQSGDPALLMLLLQALDKDSRRECLPEMTGAMQWAAGEGNNEILSLFISEGQVSVDARLVEYHSTGSRGSIGRLPKDGFYTALSLAVEAGHLGTVKMLVRLGASMEGWDGSGRPLLCSAVVSGNRELVGLLLQSGAPLDQKDGSGATALNLAEAAKRKDLVTLLVDQGKSSGTKPKAAAGKTR